MLGTHQSLVLPQITYCDIVYETTNKANREKLQKVQNMALRCILKCNKRTPIKCMHDELKVLTLKQRRDLNRAMQCYKEVNEPSSGLHYMFVPVDTARTTRRSNAKKVKVPRVVEKCLAIEVQCFGRTWTQSSKIRKAKRLFNRHTSRSYYSIKITLVRVILCWDSR